jgi:two-component system, chemotaxis family, response regulator Rcp1
MSNLMVKNDPINILLVEDNPGDVRLTEEAFKEGNYQVSLHVVQDGVEAMLFLNHEGKYQDSPRPHLILLDLHLPRKDGLETLAEIKKDPILRAIPVIMLTTSKDEENVYKAYDLQANCYVAKPLDMGQFIDIVKDMMNFWITNTNLQA